MSAIVALGNPVLWWGFLRRCRSAAFTALRRPRWQEAVAFGGYVAMFLPWLVVPRSQFIFYMLPAVPVHVPVPGGDAPPAAGRDGAAAWGSAFAAATIVVGLAYAPVWTGVWIPRSVGGRAPAAPRGGRCKDGGRALTTSWRRPPGRAADGTGAGAPARSVVPAAESSEM